MMDSVLSSLDNLEKDISNFLYRKTRLMSCTVSGEQRDENFSVESGNYKHWSLNGLDIMKPGERVDLETRHSLASDFLGHRIRTHSYRHKRRGILFPINLDIVKLGELSQSVPCKMALEENNLGMLKSDALSTNVNEKNRYPWSPLVGKKKFSNIVIEMQKHSGDETDMVDREKYELRVRIRKDCCLEDGDVFSTDKMVEDLKVPIPDGLTSIDEGSLLDLFQKLCLTKENCIEDNLAELGQTKRHHVINEYFV